MQDVVAEFNKHVGGNPNPVQAALIQRAAWLTVRVAVFDKRFALSGEMSEKESNTYLAWSNSLARVLAQLGTKSRGGTPPSLNDYLARKTKRRATEAREPAA